jgi:hypothetical protein
LGDDELEAVAALRPSDRQRRRQLVDAGAGPGQAAKEGPEIPGVRPDPQVKVLGEVGGAVQDRRLTADEKEADALPLKGAEETDHRAAPRDPSEIGACARP